MRAMMAALLAAEPTEYIGVSLAGLLIVFVARLMHMLWTNTMAYADDSNERGTSATERADTAAATLVECRERVARLEAENSYLREDRERLIARLLRFEP